MLNNAMTCVSVKNVGLESPTASLLVAFAEVQVGEVFLRVAIRRFRDGTLQIYLPTWEDGGCCLDGVEVPSDLRTEIVRETLTAYEEAEARQESPKTPGQRGFRGQFWAAGPSDDPQPIPEGLR